MAEIRFREALNQAMCEEMERDERVFLIGEEVGAYDGAYKVSQGMLKKFGEWRVRDTPIAEEVIAGVAIGAAMAGLRPIAEMMTWNFALLAMDQIINNAAKILYMSGGQFPIPVVFRGPGGPAHQLAAQHSQSFESFFAHVPGLKVVMPATPYDAKGLLKSAVRDDNPVIFIESEVVYSDVGEVPEEEYLLPIGKADVKREGAGCTVITYSKMLKAALEAANSLSEEEGVECEIVDLRTIRPLDEEAILESVIKTNRAVIVEEGWRFAGVGAEIVDRIQHNVFDHLDAPLERVTCEDVPMPYAKNLERAVIPGADKIVKAVKKVCYL
jgi:pyruvate dehydrogenase E1 component beta subunit